MSSTNKNFTVGGATKQNEADMETTRLVAAG